MIVKSDVQIVETARPECERCENARATVSLTLDLRVLGQTIALGKYCGACALIERDRLVDSLPADEGEVA